MELHVDVEPEPGAALRLLSQAVDVANDVLAAEEAAGREMYGLVDAVAPGPHGPVARFKECEPAAALRLYLTTLTSTLEELGVAGRLLPVAPQIDDRWYGNNTFGALAAVLQLPVDVAGFLADWRSSTSGPHSSWWVDESHTEAVLAPVLTWVLDAGDNLQMTVGLTHSRPHRSEAWALLVAGLRLGAQVFVRADDGPSRMRGLYAPAFGDVLVPSYEPSRPRTSHLETLVGLLRTCAPEPRGGWVQEADTSTIALSDLLTRVPPVHPLMQRVGNTAWSLFDLEHDHVVDAFVAQVLNDAQLANTHDLSVARWQVTEIGPDRHLVVARDRTVVRPRPPAAPTAPWLRQRLASRTDQRSGRRHPGPGPGGLRRRDHDAGDTGAASFRGTLVWLTSDRNARRSHGSRGLSICWAAPSGPMTASLMASIHACCTHPGRLLTAAIRAVMPKSGHSCTRVATSLASS